MGCSHQTHRSGPRVYAVRHLLLLAPISKNNCTVKKKSDLDKNSTNCRLCWPIVLGRQMATLTAKVANIRLGVKLSAGHVNGQ